MSEERAARPWIRAARPWIVCARGHEIRVLTVRTLGPDDWLLQVRVDGKPTTTTILGPAARLALIADLGGSDA